MHDPHPLPGRDLVVDGVRLYVVTHGRGERPPLLLVHGLPTSSYLWRNVMRDLESEAPTVAADLVGLGRSERPRRRGYRLAEQARLLLGLLDQLGLGEVVVAGHDEGGAVAIHLAALAPGRVVGLALLGTALHADAWPSPVAVPLLLPGMGEAGLELVRRRPSWGAAAVDRLLGPMSEVTLDNYLTPLRARGGSRGLLRLVRSVDVAATESLLRIVGAGLPPTLVLWGSDDPVRSPAYGRRLAAELPAATYVPVSGAGHLLPEECPERVAEELAGFAAELGAARSGAWSGAAGRAPAGQSAGQ